MRAFTFFFVLAYACTFEAGRNFNGKMLFIMDGVNL